MELIGDAETVSALLFTFTDQPTSLAPTITDHDGSSDPPTITVNDPLHSRLRQQVRNGFSFIQAMFHVRVAFDQTEAEYEAQTPDEEASIGISRFTYGNSDNCKLSLTYDYLTRAMMAADKPLDETFGLFATLNNFAREASNESRYIDAFRYYFLLLDTLFGDGQFKKVGLEKAFKASPRLIDAIRAAASDFREDRSRPSTPTGVFLREKRSPESIAEHLIERRGHYFHSNRKKPAAWSPERQDEARDLSWLCAMTCFYLSDEYSAPMFADELAPRHFDEAAKSGAIIMLIIDYTYIDDDGSPARKGRTNINIPGTKVTRKTATSVTQDFVKHFIETMPASSLMHVLCRQADTGKPIFEIKYAQELP